MSENTHFMSIMLHTNYYKQYKDTFQTINHDQSYLSNR